MRKYFSITSCAILIWTIYIVVFSIWSYEDDIGLFSLWCFKSIPFIAIFIIDFVGRKIKNKISLILFRIFRFFVVLFLIFFMYVSTSIMDFLTHKVPLISYSRTVKEVQKEDYFGVKHFPEKIPKGAKNYYCIMRNLLYGHDVRYVCFNIDEKYLEQVINKYRDDIQKEFVYSVHSGYKYNLPSPMSIEQYSNLDEWEKYNQEAKEYTVYILKNKKEYTSGFIISKKYKEIIYFFYYN